MKIYWKLTLALALIFGGFYLLPPYTVQATYFYLTHSSELNNMDIAFSESDEQKWSDKNNGIAPIFKTENGSRLYFLGSMSRFN